MALSHRVKKQLIYSSFFVGILVGIGALVYTLFLVPEPSCFDNLQNQNETAIDCGGGCIECELKNIKPLEIVKKEAVKATASKTSVIVEIENSNETYGTDNVPITITLLDSEGKKIIEREQASFILPKEKKYFAEVGLDVVYSIVKEVQVEIGSFVWKKQDEIKTPQLTVKNFEVKTQGKQVILEGVIQNAGAESYEKISILGIVRDKNETILGFSKTELRGITGFNDVVFKVFMPDMGDKNSAIVKNMTQVFVEPAK